MFKFKDRFDTEVWINPKDVKAVEHSKDDTSHLVSILTSVSAWDYEPASEEDCRRFLHELFTAMGEEYRYE